MKKTIFFGFILISSYFVELNAQTCGFGCLGLAGFYGGYSQQEFQADGVNSFISSINPGQEIEFKKLAGFRVGANIIRANYSSFFFSAKGYYQFLSDKQSFEELKNPDYDRVEYVFSLNNFGIAADFGFPLFSIIKLKLVEAGISAYSAKVDERKLLNLANYSEKSYKTNKMKFGYYIGSGLIFEIIKNYMSIEGTAIYSFVEIKDDLLPEYGSGSSNKINLINKGGFGGIIQVNLGLPL